jgi:hypothetical protein
MIPEMRRKVLPYLRSGAVTVLTANTPSDQDRPTQAIVRVQGHYDVHIVDLLPGGRWQCAPCRLSAPCQHILAAQMVTGWAAA